MFKLCDVIKALMKISHCSYAVLELSNSCTVEVSPLQGINPVTTLSKYVVISIPLYIYICACCGSPEKQNKAAAVELRALKLPGRAAEGRRGRGMAQPRCIPAPGRARLPVPLREHSSSFLNWIKMFLYSTCITVRLFKLDRLLSSCKNTSGK